jgi:hypothetical protein
MAMLSVGRASFRSATVLSGSGRGTQHWRISGGQDRADHAPRGAILGYFAPGRATRLGPFIRRCGKKPNAKARVSARALWLPTPALNSVEPASLFGRRSFRQGQAAACSGRGASGVRWFSQRSPRLPFQPEPSNKMITGTHAVRVRNPTGHSLSAARILSRSVLASRLRP